MGLRIGRRRDELSGRGARASCGVCLLLTLACSSGGGADAVDAEVEAARGSDAATQHEAGRADAATVDARVSAPARDAAPRERGPGESARADAGAVGVITAPEARIDAGGTEVDDAALDAARQLDTAVPPAPEASVPAADAMAPPLLSALAPRLISQSYEGELCPADSLSISAAGDDSAITIVFSTDVQGDGSSQVVSRRCTMRLGFEVPPGHSFGNLHVYASGYAAGSEGSAALAMNYAFAEQDATQRANFEQLREDYVVRGVFDQVWAPSCSEESKVGDSKVELVLEVELRASGDQQLLLSALDMGFSYIDGAQWKRCADGSILRPPPAGKDEACAGLARHPCAEGLLCDVSDARHGDDDLLQGECVDPAERFPPAGKDQACGGVADIPCANGLRCHYTSEARARRDVRGVCTPVLGRADDRCGGYPVLACAEGFVCSKNARDRCVPRDGSLGSSCELGTAECDTGLVCQSGTCERSSVRAVQEIGLQ